MRIPFISRLRRLTNRANPPFGLYRLPARGRAGLALLPLLAACETTVDVPEPEHTPSVAVSYVLDAEPANSRSRQYYEERQPFVSVSRRLYDQRQLAGSSNATIEVRDGAGTLVEQYQLNSNRGSSGYYRPTKGYRFLPDQAYNLRVSVPGVASAESQLTMPANVPVAAASLTALAANPNNPGEQRARLSVSVDDPGSSADYYIVYANLIDARGDVVQTLYPEDNTDGLGNQQGLRLSATSPYDSYPFSDQGYNGKRITLTNVVQYYNSTGGPGGGQRATHIEVTVSHITRDLFLFFNSRRAYIDSNGNPFAEPAPLHSNIKAGFGIFGGAVDATYRLPI